MVHARDDRDRVPRPRLHLDRRAVDQVPSSGSRTRRWASCSARSRSRYALFEVPSGWFADRFGARVDADAHRRLVVGDDGRDRARRRLRARSSRCAALRDRRGGRVPGLGAGLRALAARARARTRCSASLIMAAALAGALTQPLVVALVSATSAGGRPSRSSARVGFVWAAVWWLWFRDDPREHRGVNAAELALIAEGGAAAAREHAPVPWRRCSREPRAARALRDVLRRDLRLVLLSHLAADLSAARARLRSRAGRLARGPAAARRSPAACIWAAGSATASTAALRPARRPRARRASSGCPLAASRSVGAVLAAEPIARGARPLPRPPGLAALGVAPAWALCLEIGGPHAGVVSGAMNTFGNLGGTLSPVVVGICVDRLGSWNAPLFSIAALYLVSRASAGSRSIPARSSTRKNSGARRDPVIGSAKLR